MALTGSDDNSRTAAPSSPSRAKVTWDGAVLRSGALILRFFGEGGGGRPLLVDPRGDLVPRSFARAAARTARRAALVSYLVERRPAL